MSNEAYEVITDGVETMFNAAHYTHSASTTESEIYY